MLLKKLKLHQLKELYATIGSREQYQKNQKNQKNLSSRNYGIHIQKHYFDFIIPPKAKDFSITTLGRNIKNKISMKRSE